MLNTIFAVLAYFFCSVCCYQVAKLYGTAFKNTLSIMLDFELRNNRVLYSRRVEFKMQRALCVLYNVASVVLFAYGIFAVDELLALFK